MKIAQVVCAFPPYAGGIGNSAYRIGQLLAADHEITNFTPLSLKPWLKYGHGAFLPQLLWKLRKFDYIYLHYPFFGTAEVIWLFKLFFRQPKLIIHYHMDVKNLSWLAKILSAPSRLIRRRLLNQAELIISASLDYIKTSQIRNYYKTHPEKFAEIPFGLDLKKFQPKILNRPTDNKTMAKAKEIVNYINDKFIKRDLVNLLFVGALDKAHYFKGVDVLLQSLVVLAPRRWHLKIVGEGDLRPGYEALAKKLHLDKQVEFTGKLVSAELIRAFQEADLLILPSINRNEAFGLVLTEALACGVPVIASNLPGVRGVFNDQIEGLLVEPASIEDLKNKLEYIFNNETQRRQMAIAARKLAEKKYNEEAMKAQLKKIFI